MRRVLSTVLAVALLLGLGALSVLALPNSQALTTPVEAAATQPVSATAPDVTMKWNAIAMALDSTAIVPNAEILSQQVAGVQEILRWDAVQQRFQSWIPDAIWPPPGGYGVNFSTAIGEPYMLKVDNTAPLVFSLVGGVPPQSGQPGAVTFSLAGDATACKWNYISLPLDKSAITTAEQLSVAIGNGANVKELLTWDKDQQRFVSYIPDVQWPPPGGYGINFETKIGYPYFVCVNAAGVSWP